MMALDFGSAACSRWSFVPALALLLTACGTTLQHVDTKTARALLPWLDDQTTKVLVIERLGHSWKYHDSSSRALIYNVALKGRTALSVLAPDDASSSYELVLVFDEQDRLKRYSLLKVK